MRLACAARCGEVVLCEPPLLCAQRLAGRASTRSCSHCGASLGSLAEQLRGCASAHACKAGCGALFCAAACEDAAALSGHALLCGDAHSRFRAASLAAGHSTAESLLFAAQTLAFLSAASSTPGAAELLAALHASPPFAEGVFFQEQLVEETAGGEAALRLWLAAQLGRTAELWLPFARAKAVAGGLDGGLLTAALFQKAVGLAASPRAYLTQRRSGLGRYLRGSLRGAEYSPRSRRRLRRELAAAAAALAAGAAGSDSGCSEESDGSEGSGGWEAPPSDSESESDDGLAPRSLHLRSTAFFPTLPSVPHSCCANTVLSFEEPCDALQPGDALCGGPLRATLRAACDLEAGALLTRSWVGADQPLDARAAALAPLLPAACACELCVAQAALEAAQLCPGALEWAVAAAERNAHPLAEAAFRCLLLPGAAGARGEAWHGLGVALLGLGRWPDAAAAFEAGVADAPGHAALGAVAAVRAAYPPARLSGAPPPQPFSVLDAGGGRAAALSAAAFSVAQCDAAMAEAEAAAAARGGWTTARHATVPTTDLPLSALPATLAAFNAAMVNVVAPLAAAAFPGVVGQNVGARLRVHDAFLVRYDAEGGQASLPPHRDQGMLSLTLSLSAPGLDFEGGGTWFSGRAALGGEEEGERAGVVRLERGALLLFPSTLLHAGQRITRGRRYIIAAFLWLDEDEETAQPAD